MPGGHSQNVKLDLAIVSSYGPYFENAPTLGLYPTPKFHGIADLEKLINL
jgi:hypothetical protein